MAVYGAKIILTPKTGGMEYARDLAEKIQKDGEGIILDQLPISIIYWGNMKRPDLKVGVTPNIALLIFSVMGTTGTPSCASPNT